MLVQAKDRIILTAVGVATFLQWPLLTHSREFIWLSSLLLLAGACIWWVVRAGSVSVPRRITVLGGVAMVLLVGVFLWSRHLSLSFMGWPGRAETSALALTGFFTLWLCLPSLFEHVDWRARYIRGMAMMSSVALLVASVTAWFSHSAWLMPWLPLQSSVTVGVIGIAGLLLWLVQGSGSRRGLFVHLILLLISLFVLGSVPVAVVILGAALLLCVRYLERDPDMRVLPALLMLLLGSVVFLLVPSVRLHRLPLDVVPSASVSWSVAHHADRPLGRVLFGEGPGTFSLAYASYKPAAVNQTPFWDVRFDVGHNMLLTWLIEFGWIPSLFLVGVCGWMLAGSSGTQKEGMSLFRIGGALAVLMLALAPVSFISLFWIVLTGAVLRARSTSEVASISRVAKMVHYSLFCLTLIGGVAVTQYALSSWWLGWSQEAFARGDVRRAYVLAEAAAAIAPQRSDVQRGLALRGTQFLQELAPEAFDTDADEVERLLTQMFTASDRSLRLRDDSVAVWRERAGVYDALAALVDGAAFRALEAYNEAIAREPLNPALRLARVDLLLRLLAQQEQVTEVQERAVEFSARIEEDLALARTTRLASEARYYTARWHDAQGETAVAIAELEALVLQQPTNVSAALDLGLLHLRERDIVRAEQVLRRLVERVPGVADAHWYLAAIYEERGQITRARTQLEHLQRITPDDPRVIEKLRQL